MTDGGPFPTSSAAHARHQRALREAMAKPATTDPDLSLVMDELYRTGAKIGSGSTAAAVRHERATGGDVGGRLHAAKAQGYVIYLRRWLRNNPAASPGDRAAAENVLLDLCDALLYDVSGGM